MCVNVADHSWVKLFINVRSAEIQRGSHVEDCWFNSSATVLVLASSSSFDWKDLRIFKKIFTAIHKKDAIV